MYPKTNISTESGSGVKLYNYLISQIKNVARYNHEEWLHQMSEQLKSPKKYPFRGNIPKGQTLDLISLGGRNIESPYTCTGEEDYILVGDLSENEKTTLGIPDCKSKEKVFNANFTEYQNLSEDTKKSNEVSALALLRSLRTYLTFEKKKVDYTEEDAVNFLLSCLDMQSDEAKYALYANSIAWGVVNYVYSKDTSNAELTAEFWNSDIHSMTKDFITMVPMMLFALGTVGVDIVELTCKQFPEHQFTQRLAQRIKDNL